MSDHYILRNGQPVLEPDVIAWAQWYEKSGEERRVALTKLPNAVEVSTVFLSLDHGYGGAPVLWESMVFTEDEANPWDHYQDRYTSREAAENGHARIVAMIEAGDAPD